MLLKYLMETVRPHQPNHYPTYKLKIVNENFPVNYKLQITKITSKQTLKKPIRKPTHRHNTT